MLNPGVQRHALDQLQLPAEERDKRIALQQQIHSAVLTGKGWDIVPPQLRKEADTPWFQSLLTFDPAKVVEDERQPLLFVHGALDKQVPVEHVERLSDLARKESASKSVEVVVPPSGLVTGSPWSVTFCSVELIDGTL